MVDLSSYVSPKPEELAIDSMENCLEEISLSRIFAVKQLKETNDKGLVDVALGQRCLKLGRLKESQEESVDKLWRESGEIKKT